MLIFLDIDGVMVPAAGWKAPVLLSDGFAEFSFRATEVLQNLIAAGGSVMLTTSHKSTYTIDEWKSIFERRGVPLKKLVALDANNNLNRKDEILRWFAANKVNEDFIIIDDDKSLNDLPPFLKNHLVLTNPLVGLTREHLKQIETVLGKSLHAA